MTKQPEGRLVKKILKALREDIGGWWFKVWGGPFQQAGIPDIVGCCEGLFFALEVKIGRNQLEDIQVETIERIREDGKGIATEVRTVKQALDVVRQGLAEAGRLSTRSRRTRNRKKNACGPVRSGNWKDVRRGRSDRAFDDAELRRLAYRSPDEQDDNMAKVHYNSPAVTRSIRRGGPVLETLGTKDTAASHRPVRKKERRKARR